MDIVADTNIFLAVAPEEKDKKRIIELTTGCDIYAPDILHHEIGNALSAMVKRRQIQEKDVQTIFNVTQQIPVKLVKIDIPKSLTIAVQQNIYAHDAYFLYCCMSLAGPLLTLDSKLKIVAKTMSIKTLE